MAHGASLWIWASVLAALCQALRYAALKELNKHLPAAVTGYARILFSAPLMVTYLVCVLSVTRTPMPRLEPWFLLLATGCAVGQFLGTIWMVRLFQLGNFAVGTMLTKADTIITALLGSLFLSDRISGLGWLAILITAAGVIVVSSGRVPSGAWLGGKVPLWRLLMGPATQLGLLIGLVNALAYLALRAAIQSVQSPGGVPVDAAVAGTVMTVLSFLLLGSWLLVTDRANLLAIRHHLGLSIFVGFVSALGTILWFLAAAVANVAYVAAVTQVQIVFALLLSHYWFREQIQRLELIGIGIIMAGVMMFRAV